MKRKRMLPFGYKLMISYLLIVLIPVIIIGYYAYTTSVQSIRVQASSSIEGTLQQTRENIMYQVNQLIRMTDQLYWDYSMQESLRLRENGWVVYETTIKSIEPKLQNAVNLTPNRALLRFYVQNEQFPEMYALHKAGTDPLVRMETYELFHMKRILSEPWYTNLPKAGSNGIDSSVYWRQIEEDEKFGNISLLRHFYDYNKLQHIGFMRVVSRIKDMLRSVDYEKLGESSSVVVLDENERIVYASSGSRTFAKLESWSDKWTEKHLIVKLPLPSVNWTIVAMVPDKQLQKEAGKVKNLTILVCIGSFFVLAFISWFVSRFFSIRITKIIHSLNAYRDGRFDKRIQYSGNDEFYQIAEAFNEMGNHINTLIHKVYLVNVEKKEAELDALQAQINPHFLYNTLSSISKLGKLGEIDKLDEMVAGLAKFYRLTLNRGKVIIPVQLEIEQVKAYIAIQKIKYGSRIDVLYDIETDVYGYDTVKLILQPFIENILGHAFFQAHIVITLRAYVDGESIVFKIIDDGIGMKSETIKQIWAPGGTGIGYGIRNVDERIKLHFSAKYGVTIGSCYGAGTTVMIRIPLYKESKPSY
ncbi:sensor histidine kinase [Paenibacillus castaneae]|nr:histidine kinase [Paenibacillus castaneae]